MIFLIPFSLEVVSFPYVFMLRILPTAVVYDMRENFYIIISTYVL